MTKEILTRDAALTTLKDFFREKPLVFLGTGMSCALDNQFGMKALRDELLKRIDKIHLDREKEKEWAQVKESLKRGIDLESAMNSVHNHDLLITITNTTGKFIASIDRQYSEKIVNSIVVWPAINLITRLVDGLPENDPILNVLTPNYDMLLEYSCDETGIPYTNGFAGGVQRKCDWKCANQSMLVPKKVVQGTHVKTIYQLKKHIRLYKVHGSLNYFLHKDFVIENNAWMWDPPTFVARVMITPGLSKYEQLQLYRRELLHEADIAIEKESRFLFLGYGFNDKHLEEYIVRKLVEQGCFGLIITRTSNPRIEGLLKKAKNLWLVSQYNESGHTGTCIYNVRYEGKLLLEKSNIWAVDQFVQSILGG